MMPMAPTFCLRSVFCTPAMMAPTAVVWSVVLAVFASASRGWKVGSWSAMAGVVGVNVVLEALWSSLRMAPLRPVLGARPAR
jgi:hypothetical protein